jgi:hypothetical protein
VETASTLPTPASISRATTGTELGTRFMLLLLLAMPLVVREGSGTAVTGGSGATEDGTWDADVSAEADAEAVVDGGA